jgi:phosphatidylserine/phosphatidylglycerophosphate/cardiolipin synthase-like enzyme
MKHSHRAICLGLLILSLSAAAETALPGQTANMVTEVAFAPDPTALQLVLKGIAQARRSIHLAAYVFTSKPVATALLEARRRGVEVAVVADKQENQRQYSATRFLANQQLPVRLNGKYAILHDKFMIIDQQHVQTGSFNYTAAAASKNAENVLIIWNAPALAARYEAQWQRLWQEAEPLPAADRAEP